MNLMCNNCHKQFIKYFILHITGVSLSTVVLNSRDRQGKFKRLKKPCASKQPCNNNCPKIHPYIYWYNAVNPKNVFKRLKYAIEVELQHLENFLNNEIIVCQPASQPDHKNRPTA